MAKQQLKKTEVTAEEADARAREVGLAKRNFATKRQL